MGRSLDIGVGYRESCCDERIDIIRTPQVTKVMDVRDMDFPNDSFDFIKCFHVLEHLQEDDAYDVHDQTKALNEIYRVLKSNGIVLFKFPNGWQMAHYDHKSNHMINDWLNLIRKAGFKIIAVRGSAISTIDGTNRFLNAVFRYFSKYKWFIGFNSEFTVVAKK